MSAPIGNKFWELRSEHGRDKLFDTPELMWKAACEYFEWCENNPLIEIDFVGKDATEVRKPKMRAFTMHGLCRYLECNTGYFNDFAASLKGKTKQKEKDFSIVITRIKEVVYNQKFTGAAAGFLNANIIARDLGLRDKTETELTGSEGGPIQITGMVIK